MLTKQWSRRREADARAGVEPEKQMRIPHVLAAVVLVICSVSVSCSQGRNVISREQLVEMFESIADGAKWDMSKPMLWGG